MNSRATSVIAVLPADGEPLTNRAQLAAKLTAIEHAGELPVVCRSLQQFDDAHRHFVTGLCAHHVPVLVQLHDDQDDAGQHGNIRT